MLDCTNEKFKQLVYILFLWPKGVIHEQDYNVPYISLLGTYP